jgi:hypothetical protein
MPAVDGDAVTASARGVVSGRWLQLDGESAVVVAAVGADVMRQLHLVTVRTLLEIRQFDGEVCATLALAGMRNASLGYTHGGVGLLVSETQSRAGTALGTTAVRVDGGVYRETDRFVRCSPAEAEAGRGP